MSSDSRLCRAVTPAWLVYTQVGVTVAASVAAAVCAANRAWIAAFVLFAFATLTGVHADAVLRIWLATSDCGNSRTRRIMVFTETWTALVILAWLGVAIWLAVLARAKE